MSKRMNDDDIHLFQEAVKDVTPLKEITRVVHQKPITIPKTHRPQDDETTQLYDFVPQEPNEPVHSDAKLDFSRDLPNKTLRKLRQGQYNAEAELDLHGHTVNEASYALSHFLHTSLAEGRRTIRIIHGKGRQAILKNQINLWLRDHPAILAFCSAKPSKGGTGALTVLLKRNNKTKIRNLDER